MRLINVNTLRLEEFLHENPPYGILSHIWGDSAEVSFQEIARLGQATKSKRGFLKISQFLHRVREDGLRYAWVDTCCIDKTSSAELSEAINCMFTWYAESIACYAYLPDADVSRENWTQSVWFNRGWTLQELIAPKTVQFYDGGWNFLGSKSQLLQELSAVTGIEASILRNTQHLDSVSIAQRMSWAARRITTRTEDTAYCLLGIFGVHMPLIYGEGGQNAFRRLQEEIIRSSDDDSIFAWGINGLGNKFASYHGILAPDPAPFIDSGSVRRFKTTTYTGSDMTLTNRGVQFSRVLLKSDGGKLACMPLRCGENGENDGHILAVPLQQLIPQDKTSLGGGDTWVRDTVISFPRLWTKDPRLLLSSPIVFYVPDRTRIGIYHHLIREEEKNLRKPLRR
jgi:hypothetical protein